MGGMVYLMMPNVITRALVFEVWDDLLCHLIAQ